GSTSFAGQGIHPVCLRARTHRIEAAHLGTYATGRALCRIDHRQLAAHKIMSCSKTTRKDKKLSSPWGERTPTSSEAATSPVSVATLSLVWI
ncbi:MAG: hypothetical protein P8X90_28205, partial [Desulfobacterales bacterium]